VKSFKDLRESKGKIVFSKKMSKYPVVITDTGKGFHLSIDGDSVDTFKSQKEAESTAKQVLKDLGK